MHVICIYFGENLKVIAVGTKMRVPFTISLYMELMCGGAQSHKWGTSDHHRIETFYDDGANDMTRICVYATYARINGTGREARNHATYKFGHRNNDTLNYVGDFRSI